MLELYNTISIFGKRYSITNDSEILSQYEIAIADTLYEIDEVEITWSIEAWHTSVELSRDKFVYRFIFGLYLLAIIYIVDTKFYTHNLIKEDG